LDLTKYNEPLELVVPADTVSLNELILNFFSAVHQSQISSATSTIAASDNTSDISLGLDGVDSTIKIDPTPVDRPLQDQDGDGLDDELETEMYKTDPDNADTDGDGYNDLAEVQNGYNPLGAGKLGE
jgi:hypothetical protein